MHDPGRIWTACNALLDAVVNHHGGELPTRRYVSAGAPVWDCPLVAVWCERTAGYEADPTVETTQRNAAHAAWAMRTGTFALSIVRHTAAVADGQEVTAVVDEEAAAELLYTDAQRMMAALVAAVRADELVSCHSIAFLDWTVVGPAGGMVGGELRVAVGLVLGA